MSEDIAGAAATRRKLLGAAGAAVFLAGCGKSGSGTSSTTADEPLSSADIETLNGLLDVEHRAIAGYTAGIPLLRRSVVKSAQQFLNQELAHAGELIALVKKAGGKARDPAPSYDLGHPRSSDDVLRLLHTLETAQIAAYLDAIPRVSSGKARASLASILANDAQHIELVRVALGGPAVPSPFVTASQ